MLTTPNRVAFQCVRDQIGYCGLWCGSCAVGNGCLAGLSTGLRELLAAYGAPEWATVETGWDGFLKELETMKRTVSCIGCRSGGGRENCEIRACAKSRGLNHCTECPSFGSCEHSAVLDHMRSGATEVGMLALSPGEDPGTTIPKWTQQLEARWPCCVLFAESERTQETGEAEH